MSRLFEMIEACHQAAVILPARRSTREVIDYLVETYDAFEIDDPIRKARIKFHALPPEVLAEKGIRMYDVIEDFQILHQFSNDYYNIDLKIFELPRNRHTRELYDHATGTILVLFDLTNETIECINGLFLIDELIVYRGIEQRDADEENKVFREYCSSLRELGVLDDYVAVPFETQAQRTIEFLKQTD
ncbi:MAG TPA: hypothetical protein GXZ74_02005 [Tissierellia bacterium]|nr:hypothetical protein [Tissierellia bacterium]